MIKNTETGRATMNRHHATKTYSGKAACAGSGIPTPNFSQSNACTICGRTGFSVTTGMKMATHIHAQDLVGGARTPATPAKEIKEIMPLSATPAQHKAIKAFYADESAFTYTNMMLTMPADYTRYAREQGWSK